jgi:hypothetical protein
VWLFGSAASFDVAQAYNTIEALIERNGKEITYWKRVLQDVDYGGGRFDYSENTADYLREASELRWRLFSQMGKLAGAKRWVGPIEREHVRRYLLEEVPWIAFPALSDKAIAFFGISHLERARRLAITDEDPTEYIPRRRQPWEQEEAQLGDFDERFGDDD